MVPTLPFFPRPTNAQKGKWAEIIASVYFRLHGYTVLPQHAHGMAQTDLLLKRGHTVVLVEVKYRATLPAARQAMGPAQQQRLARQARLVSKRFPHASIRVDTFALAPLWPLRWPIFRHQTNAAPVSRA